MIGEPDDGLLGDYIGPKSGSATRPQIEAVFTIAPPCIIFRSTRRVISCMLITLTSMMRRKTASTSSPLSPVGVSRSRPALLTSTSMW